LPALTSTAPTLLSCKTWLMTDQAYHLYDALEIVKVVCDKKKKYAVLRISRVCPVHK